jgi:hypothetical protein
MSQVLRPGLFLLKNFEVERSLVFVKVDKGKYFVDEAFAGQSQGRQTPSVFHLPRNSR